jgi:hypothetical protein
MLDPSLGKLHGVFIAFLDIDMISPALSVLVTPDGVEHVADLLLFSTKGKHTVRATHINMRLCLCDNLNSTELHIL